MLPEVIESLTTNGSHYVVSITNKLLVKWILIFVSNWQSALQTHFNYEIPAQSKAKQRNIEQSKAKPLIKNTKFCWFSHSIMQIPFRQTWFNLQWINIQIELINQLVHLENEKYIRIFCFIVTKIFHQKYQIFQGLTFQTNISENMIIIIIW